MNVNIDGVVEDCIVDANDTYPEYVCSYYYNPVKDTYRLEVARRSMTNLITSRKYNTSELHEKENLTKFISDEFHDIVYAIASSRQVDVQINKVHDNSPSQSEISDIILQPNPDNWKHRSANMSCDTCMWFVLKEKSEEERPKIGRCRRHAPTMSGWPVMFRTDWCGDHKLDETKT